MRWGDTSIIEYNWTVWDIIVSAMDLVFQHLMGSMVQMLSMRVAWFTARPKLVIVIKIKMFKQWGVGMKSMIIKSSTS
jgi:hypothetical protein